jgi:hypothetical protein
MAVQPRKVDYCWARGSNEDLEVVVCEDSWTIAREGNAGQQGHCCQCCSLIILVDVGNCKFSKGSLECTSFNGNERIAQYP